MVGMLGVAGKDYHPLQWRFYHDKHDPGFVPDATFAFDSVAYLIALLSNPEHGKKYKACGSHWALSTAAKPENIALETNLPGPGDETPRLTGLAVDLGDIATDQFVEYLAHFPPVTGGAIASDPCLQYGFGPYFVHLKAGTRIYEAYSLLDRPNDAINNGALVQLLREKLSQTPGGHPDAFDGPWAFATLGGAGGQTVFGALTTGTHGGDYRQRPISDSVAALHLVAYGGRQYWIEPHGDRQPVPIGDEARLAQHYPAGPGNPPIKVIRDNDIFDAVVVGAGRFGVVTSIVLAVVPQYCLLEHRRLANWSDVKPLLLSVKRHHSFDGPFFSGPDVATDVAKFQRRFAKRVSQISNRFLQVAICVSPYGHGEHRCSVTQRWWVSDKSHEARHADGSVPGRAERGTAQTAGASFPYEPPDEPAANDPPGPREKPQATGTFLERACANGSFFAGVLRAAAEELEATILNGFVPPNSKSLTAIAVGAGAGIAALGAGLCPALAAAVVLLKALADGIDALGDDTALGSAVHKAAGELLDNLPSPLGLMIVRWLLLFAFEQEQKNRDYVAISYAVMDGHDYHDRSCFQNAQSIEVFFDATRPDVYCAYLDQILAFEGARQSNEGRVTIGYVSLRYVRQSRALIAPARFPETVVMEVAEIRNDDGTAPFVDNAAAVARHPMFAAPFHWGQHNPLTRPEVERIFNASPKEGALNTWRLALQTILTDQAIKDGFSNGFTMQTGLEP